MQGRKKLVFLIVAGLFIVAAVGVGAAVFFIRRNDDDSRPRAYRAAVPVSVRQRCRSLCTAARAACASLTSAFCFSMLSFLCAACGVAARRRCALPRRRATQPLRPSSAHQQRYDLSQYHESFNDGVIISMLPVPVSHRGAVSTCPVSSEFGKAKVCLCRPIHSPPPAACVLCTSPQPRRPHALSTDRPPEVQLRPRRPTRRPPPAPRRRMARPVPTPLPPSPARPAPRRAPRPPRTA